MSKDLNTSTKKYMLCIQIIHFAWILSQKVCLKGSKKGPTLAWQP